MDLIKQGKIPYYSSCSSDLKYLIGIQKALTLYNLQYYDHVIGFTIGRDDIMDKLRKLFDKLVKEHGKWPSWHEVKADIAVCLNSSNDFFSDFISCKPQIGGTLHDHNVQIMFMYKAIEDLKNPKFHNLSKQSVAKSLILYQKMKIFKI
jgi:hypothetical protein